MSSLDLSEIMLFLYDQVLLMNFITFLYHCIVKMNPFTLVKLDNDMFCISMLQVCTGFLYTL